MHNSGDKDGFRMIYLIAKTTINGDAISKINKQYENEKIELTSQHEYYVFAIQGNYEIADCIRDTNLVNVTFDDNSGFILISDNLRNLKLLVNQLRTTVGKVPTSLAQYFIHYFPQLFNSLKELK